MSESTDSAGDAPLDGVSDAPRPLSGAGDDSLLSGSTVSRRPHVGFLAGAGAGGIGEALRDSLASCDVGVFLP